MPEEKKKSLLAFHAITGCDTTSQFAGIGKQSAWKAFEGRSPELLRHLGDEIPPNTSVLADAEAFVCQLYSKGTGQTSINKARSSAFRKAKNKLDTLPPTQDALRLHITRSNYQTLIWKKALEPCPLLPKPEENGWHYMEGILKPKLVTQGEASHACLQLAFCGCSRESSCCANRRCTCVRLSLCCTKACRCGDLCRNTRNAQQDEDEE